MFLATKSCDGVKVKLMRLFPTEDEARTYLKSISETSWGEDIYFGRIWEMSSDKEPKLIYPKRSK